MCWEAHFDTAEGRPLPLLVKSDLRPRRRRRRREAIYSPLLLGPVLYGPLPPAYSTEREKGKNLSRLALYEVETKLGNRIIKRQKTFKYLTKANDFLYPKNALNLPPFLSGEEEGKHF